MEQLAPLVLGDGPAPLAADMAMRKALLFGQLFGQ